MFSSITQVLLDFLLLFAKKTQVVPYCGKYFAVVNYLPVKFQEETVLELNFQKPYKHYEGCCICAHICIMGQHVCRPYI
uniref:Secreted protein n=1 Tax=Octopus bimaculoides TaxID=37653 RepID=A0A0L8IDW1_OCTBM